MTTSKDSSSNGRSSASAATHVELDARRFARGAAGLEQLGREIARHDVRAALRGRDRGVAGARADVEHALPGPMPLASTRRGPSGVRNVSRVPTLTFGQRFRHT